MWPCESCHSLNAPKATRCYSCRAARGALLRPNLGPRTRSRVLRPRDRPIRGTHRRGRNCDGDRWRGPRGVRRRHLVTHARHTGRRGCGGYLRATDARSRCRAANRAVATGARGDPHAGVHRVHGPVVGYLAPRPGARERCDRSRCIPPRAAAERPSAMREGPMFGDRQPRRSADRQDPLVQESQTDRQEVSICHQGGDHRSVPRRRGRTVQGGAKRTTEFQLQPFVNSKTGEMVLAATGSLRLNPNRRGDSVGCRNSKSEILSRRRSSPRPLVKP